MIRTIVCFLLCISVARRYKTAYGPRDGVLNVHLFAHTHDDTGWLKSVDDYYSGLKRWIPGAKYAVKYILDTTIRALAENKDRKFVYVEQAFFQRWWREQDDEIKELTKKLVANGQLSFANGGWCMHDEATPHFRDMIDQTTYGHKFLLEQFGFTPTVGWQIDPFGHSSTQAALLSAEVGFDSLFFGRIDYQDRAIRKNESRTEFVWRASPSLGPDAEVFTALTGVMTGVYVPFEGFRWGVHDTNDFIQDDPDLDDYNVKEKVDLWVEDCLKKAAITRGNHIFVTMGTDFEYENAWEWFDNMDKLIHYVNLNGSVNTFYSNPSIYTQSKYEEKLDWTVKEDDFFPYASNPTEFWTGYFTSRPALKHYVRKTSSFLQMARQVLWTSGSNKVQDLLQPLNEAMGVLQHHDAVSGTEKQFVAFNYAKRLARGRELVSKEVFKVLQDLTGASHVADCELRNISQCDATKNAQHFTVAVWNSLGRPRTEWVEIPVSSNAQNVMVTDSDGNHIPSVVVDSPNPVTNYYRNNSEWQPYIALVQVTLPAAGFSTVSVDMRNEKNQMTSHEKLANQFSSLSIESDHYRVTFSDDTRLITSISYKSEGTWKTMRATQMFYWYADSMESGHDSNAYIFRPPTDEAIPVSRTAKVLHRSTDGPVQEVQLDFGWIQQRVRVCSGCDYVQFTYTVGEVPIADKVPKEVISRITFPDIKNKGTFYTDSNGREMIERRLDYRFSWDFNQTNNVSGNYYPCTTGMYIQDGKTRATVLTDTSQGCTSRHDGELEFAVHRRMLHGIIGEPLNETEFSVPYTQDCPPAPMGCGAHYGPGLIIRGNHWLTFGDDWRKLQDRIYDKPHLFFMDANSKAKSMSLLKAPLPWPLELITLDSFANHTLVRIAHQIGIKEKPGVETISLSDFFQFSKAELRSLTGNQKYGEMKQKKKKWTEAKPYSWREKTFDGDTIAIGPLEIITIYMYK